MNNSGAKFRDCPRNSGVGAIPWIHHRHRDPTAEADVHIPARHAAPAVIVALEERKRRAEELKAAQGQQKPA